MIRFIGKLVGFTLLALVMQILISLNYKLGPIGNKPLPILEKIKGISVEWPALNAYKPDSQVQLFQQNMKTHPRMGFLFRENLGNTKPLKVKWADQAESELMTDEMGFVNSKYALEARRAGKPIEIIGVGSSFMQGAAGNLHDFFWAKGAFYYNMATPRQTLPQFTMAVKEFAIREKPKWILYDLNETSIELMQDYENWLQSGMDWFTYHSGTWCGPPKRPCLPYLERFPKLEALYHGVRKRIYPENRIPQASDDENIHKALKCIVEARDAAQAHGIHFMVVAIPSKQTSIYGKSARWKNIDALLPQLEKAGVRVLSLLDSFSKEEDPRALYYEVDGHWNGYGILKASMLISQSLAEAGGI